MTFRQGMYVLDFELYVYRDLVKDSLCSEFLKNRKMGGKKKENKHGKLSGHYRYICINL